MLEVGYPERMTIFNENQYEAFISEYNGKKNIYRSVYHFLKYHNRKPDYDSCILDQIYFDFDDGTHDVVKDVCKKLHDDNLSFRVNFSGGRGFHVYIACEPKEIHRKSYLTSMHKYILNNYSIENFDSHIIGNIKQMRRIENTQHIGSKLYCIPLKYDEIFLSFDEIKKLAETPRTERQYWFEGKPFVLPDNEYKELSINENHNLDSSDGIFGKLPELPEPCILRILHLRHPGHEERFLLCLWLSYHLRNKKDIRSFNINELKERIISMMKTLNWDDYSEAENTAKSTRYQVSNILMKNYNFVPDCNWRKQYGICTCNEDICKRNL